MVCGDRQLPQPHVQRERPSGQLRARVLLRNRRYVGQGLRLHHTHGGGRPALLYGRQTLPDVDRYEGPPPAGIPAPRDENDYPAISLPHPPSFDEKNVSDKPGWVSDNPPLSLEQKRYMEELYRKRLQSMLAVDDMIGELVGALHDSGELDNTYIFFTSDNGFHLGEHRLSAGKWTPYEEDIRVPLIVRGPGVPEGETLPHMVLNNDLAPTFADLAGAEPPSFVDGRSLK